MNKIAMYGGLGNQMFQYALFVAFRTRGIEARISPSRYLYEYFHHGFDLWKAFRLPLPVAQQVTCALVSNMEPYYRNRLCRGVMRRIMPRLEHSGYTLYQEKEEFRFDPLVFKQRNSFLRGTWQVERYFRNCHQDVRRAFIFRVPPRGEVSRLVERMRGCSSVSLHVRRGDYYGSEYEKTHSVLRSLRYYGRALDQMRELVADPHFFVFSDDLPWVRRHLSLPGATFVEVNRGDGSYLDMYLMSNCRHNIISNSTFSWWGAWLNPNQDKIVTIPVIWLKGRACPGIYPEGWVKIAVS
jgi:hypothetical protein